MAKQTLPTNFTDDILDASMGGKRRYNLIQNSDGTVSLEDVTDYTQVGSDFGASQMNQTNQAVNESCDKSDVIETASDIMANQAGGKIAGAKAVKELEEDIQCGSFINAKHGDIIKIKRPTRLYSGVIVLPRYNTGISIRCNMSASSIEAGGQSFSLQAYDTETGLTSTSNSLAGTYIVIPYS